MNAAEVRAALTKRWPDDQHLHITEAPLDSSRQGTKIDVLVVSLWASKGHEIDAIEVKVSYQDWKREIQRVTWTVAGRTGITYSSKAQANRARSGHGDTEHDWYYYGRREPSCYGLPERHCETDLSKSLLWRQHCHRFWIATPLDLAVKIRDELPEGWGLIGCTDDHTTTVTAPTKLTPKPLTWPQTIGLLRSAADAGVQALWRAEARGYNRAKNVLAAS